MVVHVSLFKLCRTLTAEDRQKAKELLENMKDRLEGAAGYKVYETIIPEAPAPEGAPVFYDYIQTIMFEDPQCAVNYPVSAAHIKLMEETKSLFEQVGTIDYTT